MHISMLSFYPLQQHACNAKIQKNIKVTQDPNDEPAPNIPQLQAIAKFGTDYFLLKIKILAKRKSEITKNSQLRKTAVSGWQFNLHMLFAFHFFIFFFRVF